MLQQLIALVERRIAVLVSQRDSALSCGDAEALTQAEARLADAEQTLARLKSLPA